jgi:light-independent protochlorophyllide reductase subunit B
MQLAVWTYEGPAHVGAMRVATAMTDLHYVLHAPQGDTYADLLFTMIERRSKRPPVTFTTFEARDLGSDTAEIFKRTAKDAFDRFAPRAMLVGESCTAELLQDNPGGLAKALDLPVPVIPLDLPSYQRKEHWGASETFYQIVRHLAEPRPALSETTGRPSCNLLGATALGFRHRDDIKEMRRLLNALCIDVNVCAPLDASTEDIRSLAAADFNVVLYPEVAETAARWLKKTFGQPFTETMPLGVTGVRRFVEELQAICGIETGPDALPSNMSWWSRSIDSTYLTGKRVFLFGEGYRVAAAARVASEELGFSVVGMGCYNREAARAVRTTAKELGVDPLITDDYLAVEDAIAGHQPELVLGTQMERHIAKRLGIPCAVISAPFHVQDCPARYSPQYGPEGANVLFDTWVHPLVMGLEEHLLGMFRDDFEFSDEAGPSHLAAHTPAQAPMKEAPAPAPEASETLRWEAEAEKELRKIPFFVRGKARRNTEAYAQAQKLAAITIETLYEAKAHYGR